ncbi:MAG TPA: TonB-dependent receptor [Alphaproteobacteria bacterium]|nr:TonB-dependent receptor [Alphaproteobacteria bacterium]
MERSASFQFGRIVAIGGMGLLATASDFALVCGTELLSIRSANAQTTVAGATTDQSVGSNQTLEEVVVTATKREQNLQIVPVAVTAISATELEQQRIVDVNGLSGLAPNLSSYPQTNGAAVPVITIRGLSTGTGGTAVDTPIAIYVDGVYIGRANGSDFDLADIERVEVLRGPQGTLYGRNATGGAINIITKGPTGQFGAAETLSFGNYAEFRSKTRIDLPEWNGLSAEITYMHDQSDGWVKNTQPGIAVDYSGLTLGHVGTIVGEKTLGLRDVDAVHAALRYTGIDNLTLDYKVDYTDQRDTQAATQLIAVDPPFLAFYQGLSGVAPIRSIIGGYGFVGLQPQDSVPNPLMGEEHLREFAQSLTAAYKATDWLNFKNIVSFREFDDQWPNELTGDGGAMIGGRPYTFLDSIQSQAQHQLTEEFQVLVNTKLVDLIGGVFYFHEVSPWYDANIFASVVPAIVPANFAIPGISQSTNDSTSVYGHATFHITDQLDLTGGVRASWDDRETDDLSETIAGLAASDHTASFYHTDWLIDLTYRPTQDLMTYFKVSTGYLSGGVFAGIPFAPETITSYEVGAKADLFEKRLRVNGALFHANLNNLQQQQYFNGILQFRNIGSSTIDGAELEVDAIPLPNLTVSGSWGFTNYHYDVFLVNGVNVANQTPVSSVPKTTLHFSAQYDLPETSWGATPTFRIDATYRSNMYTNTTPTGVAALDNQFFAPGYWDVGMRASLSDIPLGPATGTISAWSKNTLDARVPNFILNIGTSVLGQYTEGRTFGVDLTVKY